MQSPLLRPSVGAFKNMFTAFVARVVVSKALVDIPREKAVPRRGETVTNAALCPHFRIEPCKERAELTVHIQPKY